MDEDARCLPSEGMALFDVTLQQGEAFLLDLIPRVLHSDSLF
jgi:hypothetical protein